MQENPLHAKYNVGTGRRTIHLRASHTAPRSATRAPQHAQAGPTTAGPEAHDAPTRETRSPARTHARARGWTERTHPWPGMHAARSPTHDPS